MSDSNSTNSTTTSGAPLPPSPTTTTAQSQPPPSDQQPSSTNPAEPELVSSPLPPPTSYSSKASRTTTDTSSTTSNLSGGGLGGSSLHGYSSSALPHPPPQIGSSSSSTSTAAPVDPHNYSQQGFNFERLKSELVRLETFNWNGLVQWGKPFISPEECAKAGFFFLRDSDKVQCVFCNGVVGEWESGDVPLVEHKRHFPKCPFICGLPVGNIPLTYGRGGAPVAESSSREQQLGGVDVCGPYRPTLRVRPNAKPDQVGFGVRGAQPLMGNMEDVTTNLAIRTGSGPAKKHLVTYDSRLATFTSGGGEWIPSSSKQRGENMAEAGFYYIGLEDHVKCFYCDGGLRNWEPQDDPWVEHARWFSHCPFVLLNKGADYIKGVVEAHPPILPEHTLTFHQQQQLASRPAPTVRVVSDDEVKAFVESQIVQNAVEMGVSIDGIQSAIRHKLQRTGIPFESTEELLEAVLSHDDGEYWSDAESSSADDDDDDEWMSQRGGGRGEERGGAAQRVPPSAGAVLAARLAAAAKEAVSTEESSAPVGSRGGIRNSSSSTSEDEEVAAGTSRAGSGSGRLRTASNSSDSSSSAAGEKCSSPGADSGGEYSMSNGSEEDEGAGSKKGREGDKKNAPAPPPPPVINLEEEVRKLKEARQCKICMDNEADVVFLPCGHLISCVRCATALSTCALCRQEIKAVVRTYMS